MTRLDGGSLYVWISIMFLSKPTRYYVEKKETGQISFRLNKELKIWLHIWVLMSVTFYERVFLAWLQEENIGLEILQGPL